MRPHSFHVLSGLQSSSHGALALALAGEFGDFEVEAVEGALWRLAEPLRSAAERPSGEQLGYIGARLAGELVACGERRSGDLDDLRFDRVATSGRGHALLCALVAIEAARLAGVELGLVASPSAAYVGHRKAGGPMVLSPGGGWELVDVRVLGDVDLSWHCPHEAAGMVLGMLLARGRRTGQVGVQLRAAELCLALPVGDSERHRLHLQLARVRARLN